MPVIKLFWDICLFRRGPQDVPASYTLLSLAAAAYVLIGLGLLVLEAGWPEAVAPVVAEAAMMLGFLWATLAVTGLKTRFLKTLIAMLGTDALISSFAIPLVVLNPGEPQALAAMWITILQIWHLGVVAQIFRQALSRPLWLGLVLAVAYLLIRIFANLLLFAPPM